MLTWQKNFPPAGVGRSTVQLWLLIRFQTYKQNAIIIQGTILYPNKPTDYILLICFYQYLFIRITFVNHLKLKYMPLYSLKPSLFPSKNISTAHLSEFKINKRLLWSIIVYIQISLTVPLISFMLSFFLVKNQM